MFDRLATTLVIVIALAAFCSCVKKPGAPSQTKKDSAAVHGPMTLDVCGDKKLTNPSDAQIRAGLATLDEKQNDAFAVLGPTGMTYVQVAGDQKAGFLLEYQEGSLKAHYRAKGPKLSLDQVAAIFIAYRDGKDWKKGLTFEKVKL